MNQKKNQEKTRKTGKVYVKPEAKHTKISLGVWAGSCSGSCLAPSVKINTPSGEISILVLKVGDLVWTISKKGEKIVRKIIKISKTRVPASHKMVEVIFSDGRRVLASPDHPIAGERKIRQLFVNEIYDGSKIMSVKLVGYDNNYTYDILPESETGYYWSNGILLGSTLMPREVPSVVKIFTSVRFT